MKNGCHLPQSWHLRLKSEGGHLFISRRKTDASNVISGCYIYPFGVKRNQLDRLAKPIELVSFNTKCQETD